VSRRLIQALLAGDERVEVRDREAAGFASAASRPDLVFAAPP
jgi:hypothetical protein